MVETESVVAPPVKPGGVRATRADRDKTGRWWLTLEVDATVPLPDGRVLRFVKHLRVGGGQLGRKPRPRVPPGK